MQHHGQCNSRHIDADFIERKNTVVDGGRAISSPTAKTVAEPAAKRCAKIEYYMADCPVYPDMKCKCWLCYPLYIIAHIAQEDGQSANQRSGFGQLRVQSHSAWAGRRWRLCARALSISCLRGNCPQSEKTLGLTLGAPLPCPIAPRTPKPSRTRRSSTSRYKQ